MIWGRCEVGPGPPLERSEFGWGGLDPLGVDLRLSRGRCGSDCQTNRKGGIGKVWGQPRCWIDLLRVLDTAGLQVFPNICSERGRAASPEPRLGLSLACLSPASRTCLCSLGPCDVASLDVALAREVHQRGASRGVHEAPRVGHERVAINGLVRSHGRLPSQYPGGKMWNT